MTRSPKPIVRPSRRLSRQTLGTALAISLASAGVAVVACTTQVNTGASSSTPGPFCPSLDGSNGYQCNVGDPPCFLPAESNCNGEYYCWDDHMWHCAPPDSGGPAPVVAGDDDESDAADAADDAQPAGDAGLGSDAAVATDATSG